MSHLWNSVKYKGLINQGATCYLNSVLQVLFMTDDFRKAVERDPETECIDVQLNSLFGKLKDQNADTIDITKTLDIRRVNEQQDAAEYFEKILNLSSAEASQIFHGKLTHGTVCSGCGTHTDTDDQFWHLPLTLVDSCSEYSVVNSIEDYFKATTFSGENQMYCERCDDKRDASVQCVVKDHPEVLTLLLKRFELDYYSMTYFKVNCTVCIPYTLQIPKNQTYELYAVVDHVGHLRHGHYTACIKPQEEDRWFNFDDSWVSETHYQPFRSDNFERSNRAYLLFYRKKSDTRTPEDIGEVSAPGGCSPSTSDVEEPREAVMMNGGEKVEEKAETGVDIQMVETDRESVSSEEEVKAPEPRCHVKDLENRDCPTQDTREEFSERNDSCLQLQDGEKEEVKTAPDNEQVVEKSVEAEKKEDISGGSLRDESDENDENQDCESKNQNVKTLRQGRPQEACVDVQIENGRNVMEGKRDEDRDGKRETGGKGRYQDNEGKDEAGKEMKVDPEGKQEGGEDTRPYREVERGGEKNVKGDFTAVSKVKSGADKVESRSGKPFTKLDPDDTIQNDVRVGKGTQNMPKDDRMSKQRRGSQEQHRVENTDVQRRPERGVKDKKSSDDSSQERARRVVSAAETQVKRRHSERAQDRDRSSHGGAAPVRSRSLLGGQREVRKREKKTESDKRVVEEIQHLKESGTCKEEEKKGTQRGIQERREMEEITLETPPSGTRKRKRDTDFFNFFQCLSLNPKAKELKIEPGTETSATETLEQVKTPSCFSFLWQ